MVTEAAARRSVAAWYTPDVLVDLVVTHALDGWEVPRRTVRVVDPACGDGRFLRAVALALERRGAPVELTGVDIDAGAIDASSRRLAGGPASRRVELHHADALTRDWPIGSFDLVVGNPPFLSPLSSNVSRRPRRERRVAGAPYADAAVEFLALAFRLAQPVGARVGLVLPQSVLASRDAAAVRAAADRLAHRHWSWWSRGHEFDAAVHVCALVFETPTCVSGVSPNGHADLTQASGRGGGPTWSDVVTKALGVPALPALECAGTLAERATLRADFRDQYYGLVPAVVDGGDGVPLVTSGLIDPGCVQWGSRPARFARRAYAEPRVDLARLSPTMQAWAHRKLVAKVLVASQTRALEAVADPGGRLLPAVPVTSVTPLPFTAPDGTRAVWEIAAVLTSPVASAWAWHRCAGTGLSSSALRTGPRVLAALPWPAGPLDAAVAALRSGDVTTCGMLVDRAFGVGPAPARVLGEWWRALLPRQPVDAAPAPAESR